MTVPRAYRDLDVQIATLTTKLESKTYSFNQLQYERQLDVRRLVQRTDEAVQAGLERDEAERALEAALEKIAELESEVSNMSDYSVNLENALAKCQSGKATAEAWLSLKNGGLK